MTRGRPRGRPVGKNPRIAPVGSVRLCWMKSRKSFIAIGLRMNLSGEARRGSSPSWVLQRPGEMELTRGPERQSGRPDSNWRLPAPKAGALTRLRYAP